MKGWVLLLPLLPAIPESTFPEKAGAPRYTLQSTPAAKPVAANRMRIGSGAAAYAMQPLSIVSVAHLGRQQAGMGRALGGAQHSVMQAMVASSASIALDSMLCLARAEYY